MPTEAFLAYQDPPPSSAISKHTHTWLNYQVWLGPHIRKSLGTSTSGHADWTFATVLTPNQPHMHLFYVPLNFVRDYPGEPVPEPIWSLLKQETVTGKGISWAICKSAPHHRQISTPACHHSVVCRQDALPAAQPTVPKH